VSRNLPWSYRAKRDALFILAVIVPALMIGLGLGGYFAAKALGFAEYAPWIAIFSTTVGLVASVFVTLKIGEKYESQSKDGKLDSVNGSASTS
jgi:F0F1-type ATP synthase assembly protein I